MISAKNINKQKFIERVESELISKLFDYAVPFIDKKINIKTKQKEENKKTSSLENILNKILNMIEKENRELAPAFVFIDPFGFSGIPLDIIERIMRNKRCEALITFMYEDIDRWKKN